MAYELVIQAPDTSTRRQPLEGERYTVGRAQDNDLCYPEDQSLSRRHLQIYRVGEQWFVEDLKSKNGTLLNGVLLAEKRQLRSRDRLAAGQIALTFVDSEDSLADPRVVFVPGTGPEAFPSGTVMTSLEGLLSGGDATSPILRAEPDAQAAAADRRAFDSPVVRALIRAGREIAYHRPLEELFQLILDLSIEAVSAQRGVLMTLDGDRLVPRAVHGAGFRISTTVRDRVLNEKASLLVRDVQREESLREQKSIVSTQIHSLMAVPLQTEDRVIGLIYLDSSLFAREFTPDDLNLLTVLANVAAIRIEQELYAELRRVEQLRTRDLEQAAEIQRGILPRGAPAVTGLDVAGYNAACRTVGGDYYDFLTMNDGRLGLVLGDVAGKGMSAALLMSNLQARVQLLAEECRDVATLVTRLNRSLTVNCPTNRFITLFLGWLDPRTGRLVYCNAGHNPPLVIRASGEVTELGGAGTVLGILPEALYHEQVEQLEPGDLLAAYSDGVTEAANAEEDEFGTARLAEVLVAQRGRPAAVIIGAVNDAVREFTSAAPAADDITLVVARRLVNPA